jgi:hypothetical protein
MPSFCFCSSFSLVTCGMPMTTVGKSYTSKLQSGFICCAFYGTQTSQLPVVVLPTTTGHSFSLLLICAGGKT